MASSLYSWKWKRSKGKRWKHFLELLRNGKKIGHTQEVWHSLQCVCIDTNTCECAATQFEAYKGGGKIGDFPTMTDAKIAVEHALGVSTKKSKKKQEPERI